MSLEHEALSHRIIQAAYAVHSTLGSGFLEKVYHNAMVIELREAGIRFQSELPITVIYKGFEIGSFFADMLVENRIILEFKAVENLTRGHEVQLVNYLAATGIDNGLLINFGSSVHVKRKFRVYRKPSGQR
jgi:GxxExxY protein